MSTTEEKELRATFKQKRETPGTVVFSEVGDGPEVIGSIYIKKTAMKDLGNPKAITITVAAT
jgi:hypothetical protein